MGEQEQAGDGGSVIRFGCKSCGQKIRVPQSLAGKKGKCPKCKGIIIIPASQDFAQVSNRNNPANLKISSNKSGLDPSLFDIPQTDTSNLSPAKDDVFDESLQAMAGYQIAGRQDKAEQTGERKFPWLIDIFLYPTGVHGLAMLGILVGGPLLIDMVAWFLSFLAARFLPFIVFAVFFATIGGIVKFIFFLYAYWYLCECIRDSAAGNVRAPDVLVNSPGLVEILLQILRLLVCFIIFWGPAIAFTGFTVLIITVTLAHGVSPSSIVLPEISRLSLLLLIYAFFFFPMGLLAVVMFDSLRAMNPILIVGSIISTFFQYVGLILVLYLLAGLTDWIVVVLLRVGSGSLILAYIIQTINIYLLMIGAHFLGRFCWRYREKLNWEV